MYLIIITGVALLVSFIANRKKTLQGLKKAWKKFAKMVVPLTVVLVLVSFALYFMTPQMISKYLSGGHQAIGVLIASAFGSITMMPGFIAFPLGGILRDNNVSYMIISAFTTTLMMVGVLTFPVEQKFLGTRVAVIRNIAGLFTALIVALVTGIIFGEIFV
ncbi:MAG: hypothetical protein JEY99_08775 [Spirochaetales bacterium]|nr:hypothetical protein [Spirochaetales bacterium]